MSAFVKVLDEVQVRAREAGRSAKPFTIGLAQAYDHPAEDSVTTAHAVAAYRLFQREARAEQPPPPQKPTPAPVSSLVAGAMQSPQRLKALRRQLAWRLHPDRDPDRDSGAMAEVNAAIDAALGRSSKGRG
ncbi:MAG: hypothetical protein ACR652_16780 [Methylocystis sp.]|uniref:hypothetical protein n=1 Tax=Methylocystis sp. TaxID=1911079 RepID=UPI003DA4ACF6